MAQAGGGVDLQLDQASHSIERVAKHEASAVERTEQIARNRKAAAFDAREEQGRPAGGIDAALDFRDFQVGIDFGVDAHAGGHDARGRQYIREACDSPCGKDTGCGMQGAG